MRQSEIMAQAVAADRGDLVAVAAYLDALEEDDGSWWMMKYHLQQCRLSLETFRDLGSEHLMTYYNDGCGVGYSRGLAVSFHCKLEQWRRTGTTLAAMMPFLTLVDVTDKRPARLGSGWLSWQTSREFNEGYVLPQWIWPWVQIRAIDSAVNTIDYRAVIVTPDWTEADHKEILSGACLDWSRTSPEERRRIRGVPKKASG